MRYVYSLVVIAVLTGCSLSGVPENATKMEVMFSWKGIDRCSDTSPEIQLGNIPKETVKLDVTLKDLDVPTWNHGGGVVEYTGKSIIPKGSLHQYNGPCPPSGQHTYKFVVLAKDKSDVIIGHGSAIHNF